MISNIKGFKKDNDNLGDINVKKVPSKEMFRQ
jgi:hypothetical protein